MRKIALNLILLLFAFEGRSETICPCEKDIKKMSQSNQTEQEYSLAKCRLKDTSTGTCAKKDEAHKTIEKLAQNGHTKSEYLLGWWYLVGRTDSKPDYEKAHLYLEKAANKDLPAAQHELGQMYETGMGRPVDLARSREWYTKAKKNGDPRASTSVMRVISKQIDEAKKK